MAEGKTACEIGTILGISPITVNTHIANAKMKLGV
ncbi:helix-turn-helix domain-containing protein, partial [Rhizobium leguminosarum]